MSEIPENPLLWYVGENDDCQTCHEVESQDEKSHQDGFCSEETDSQGEHQADVVVGEDHYLVMTIMVMMMMTMMPMMMLMMTLMSKKITSIKLFICTQLSWSLN